MSSNARGGGLITLVKKGLQYQVMKVNEEMARGGIEMQCVEVFGGRIVAGRWGTCIYHRKDQGEW